MRRSLPLCCSSFEASDAATKEIVDHACAWVGELAPLIAGVGSSSWERLSDVLATRQDDSISGSFSARLQEVHKFSKICTVFFFFLIYRRPLQA